MRGHWQLGKLCQDNHLNLWPRPSKPPKSHQTDRLIHSANRLCPTSELVEFDIMGRSNPPRPPQFCPPGDWLESQLARKVGAKTQW